MIDFTVGANPLGPSNKARNAIRSHVRKISTISPKSLNNLKGYIAKREGVSEASILFGCGSTAILHTILERVRPKKILVPYPVSHRHSAILAKHSLECTTVSLKEHENFDLNIEDFCDAMDGCDAALLPNPNDVAGTVVSLEDMIKVVDEADRHGIHLFVDESYAEYTGMPSLAVRIINSSSTLMVRTFSTFHALGGLRLGYVIGSSALISSFEEKLDPSLINSFALFAAIASMKDKGYRQRTLLFIEGEKAYIREKLSRIQGVKCYVSPSNLLVIRLQKNLTNFRDVFERRNILINACTDSEGNVCIRFPVQTHRLNAYFVRTLFRIMEA